MIVSFIVSPSRNSYSFDILSIMGILKSIINNCPHGEKRHSEILLTLEYLENIVKTKLEKEE